MELSIDEKHKIVEIWLTGNEQRDQALRDRLVPLYGKYKALGYLSAVMLSGQDDLTELTSGLLCDNRRRLATQEVEKERRERQLLPKRAAGE